MDDSFNAEAFSRTAGNLNQLFADRDDLSIGVAAILLDLYRVQFSAGHDTKEHAVARLQIQVEDVNEEYPGRPLAGFLQFFVESLESGKLDAAKLLRDPAVGRV